MYKIFYPLIIIALLTSMGCNDDIPTSEVPSIVENTFESHFNQVMDVEWERINDDFEVSFEVNNVDHDALLDNAGNLVRYKFEIDRNSLPKNINSVLEKEYPSEKLEDFEKVVEGENSYYQLEIDHFLNDEKVVIDSLGNPLSNSKYWN